MSESSLGGGAFCRRIHQIGIHVDVFLLSGNVKNNVPSTVNLVITRLLIHGLVPLVVH